MRYYLWINEKQDGPYHSDGIRRMLAENKIPETTLATVEGGEGEWLPIKSIQAIINPPKPPVNKIHNSQPSIPEIKESTVASVLTVIAILDILGAVLGGFAIADGNTISGIFFAVGGVLGGLILLGFAKVIENTNETSQRLRQITILIQQSIDNRK